MQISHWSDIDKGMIRHLLLQYAPYVTGLLTYSTTYLGFVATSATTTITLYGITTLNMSDDTKNTLGNTIEESLNDDFQSIDILGLSVLHVKVEPLLPLNNNDFSENGSVRLLDDEKSVVVSIIIDVEYIPPPQIDFDDILKRSIQNEGESMLQLLTNSGDEFFSDLKYITTNAPTLAPQAMDSNIILDEIDKDVIEGDPDIILDEEDKGVIEEDPDVVLEEEDSKVGMIMAILFSILAALAAGFAAIYFFKKRQESKK